MIKTTINLWIRPKNRTDYVATATQGYLIGKVLFVHKNVNQDHWVISSINGATISGLTDFKTRKRAIESALIILPYIENILDDKGNDKNDNPEYRLEFKKVYYSEYFKMRSN